MAARDAPYRPLRTRARAAVTALGLCIVCEAGRVVNGLVSAPVMQDAVDNPDAIDFARVDATDRWDQIVSTGLLAAFLVAAVLFLVWMHRAAKNLPVLGMLPRYSPAWSVGSWFVPIINLFIPKRATNDLYRAGDEFGAYPRVLDLWWAAWLLSWLVDRFTARAWTDAEDYDEYRDAYYGDVLAGSLSILAAVLAILVVRAITRRQAERFAEVGAAPPPPVPTGTREPGPDAPEGFTTAPGWARATD